MSQPKAFYCVLHPWEIQRAKELFPDFDGKRLGGWVVVETKKITPMDAIREKIQREKPRMDINGPA